MAKRNTFGVDETLESTFSWEMIRRCFVYIRREGRLFLLSLIHISSICSRMAP